MEKAARFAAISRSTQCCRAGLRLAAGAAILALGIGLPPSVAFDQTTPLPQVTLPPSARPLARESSFRVNSANAVRAVIVRSESSGVSEIATLALEARLEEAWAYLPDHALWVEIGENERDLGDSAEVEIDSAYLTLLIAAFGGVHIYHFHPRHLFAVGAAADAVNPLSTLATSLAPGALGMIAHALAGPTDVATSVQIAALSTRIAPQARVQHFVLSPYGVVSYGLTTQGLRRVGANRGPLRDDFALHVVLSAWIALSADNIAKTVRKLANPTIEDVILSLCAQLSGRDYEVLFQPFADQAAWARPQDPRRCARCDGSLAPG
jgi:hypothetical protein